MLVSSERCTGCFACLNACPTKSITAIIDKEGFLQPFIDKSKCIVCEKCQKACPMLNESFKEGKKTPTIYAAWCKDKEMLDKSSSGGMFGVLARHVIENGGVVFGAAFDDSLSVLHIMIDSMEKLDMLHGSKYVQSFIGHTYQQAKEALNNDKMVLFSGTPCQIAGLYHFLGKDYNNLYTCDIICHGVPSPGIYKKYLEYIKSKLGKDILKYEMRSKLNGWSPLSSTILFLSDGSQTKEDNAFRDPYMNGFLSNLYLRKPCYSCNFAKIERDSDITIGDFWGIGNEIEFKYETKQGVSLVMVNSIKGEKLIDDCKGQFVYEERTLEEAVAGNSMLLPHTIYNKHRADFFKDYEVISFAKLIRKYLRKKTGILCKFNNMIAKIIGIKNVNRIKILLKRGQ